MLKISTNTVIAELKKTSNVNPHVCDMVEHYKLKKLEVEIYYTAEMDEFWSFVAKKSNQRWTWYAMDKASGIILAWHNGSRTDADFRKLIEYLENIPIDFYYTDDWGAYSRYLSQDRHCIGNDRMWKTERKNLNFRTHLKRLLTEKLSVIPKAKKCMIK